MADTNITMTTAGGVRLETEGTYVDTDIVVAPDSTSQANLIPENIRSGVSILNVDGTLNPQDGLSMYTTTATLVTTGTGTIAATAINLPTGRTLQVDDLLVDTAGTVVRVTAVGTNVSYTYYASYRGPAGTNGTDGTDGTDGEDGLSMYPVSTALVTSGTGSVPLSNITLPEFRSIQIGDLLLGTNGVVGRVTSTGSTVSYTAFTDIHGENGEDGAPGANGADGENGKTPVLTQSTINFIPSTTQNGQFTIGAEVEVGDPIIIACKGSGTYEGRTWVVVGSVMSFASTSHVAVVDVTGVTETTGEQGQQGQAGAAGVGVPSGGTTGQVLAKSSATNYDTEWVNPGIQSNTASQSAFSTVSNIVTTTADSPDASSLPDGTLVIKIAS